MEYKEAMNEKALQQTKNDSLKQHSIMETRYQERACQERKICS